MSRTSENLDCVGGAPIAHAVDAALLAEIVAFFDVLEIKYGEDATGDDEWPTDWLRRARKALESSENSDA